MLKKFQNFVVPTVIVWIGVPENLSAKISNRHLTAIV